MKGKLLPLKFLAKLKFGLNFTYPSVWEEKDGGFLCIQGISRLQDVQKGITKYFN